MCLNMGGPIMLLKNLIFYKLLLPIFSSAKFGKILEDSKVKLFINYDKMMQVFWPHKMLETLIF